MKNEIEPSRDGSSNLAQRLDRFFFAEQVPYGLALVRILLPLVLLVDVVRRWPFARELYSLDGATAPVAQSYGYYDLLPEFSGTIVVALYSVLVFSLITSSLGWFTRTSLATATVLYTYFGCLDMVSTLTKYVAISAHVLLLLTLARPGLIWSVDAWLKGRRARSPWPSEGVRALPTTPVWPQRLIQLLIAIVYFGATMTKLHTPGFFSGEQMQ